MKMTTNIARVVQPVGRTTLFARRNLWVCALLCFSLSFISHIVVAASDDVGEILINGELIPHALFGRNHRMGFKDYKDCLPTEKREAVVDLVVAALQYEIDTGRKIRNNQGVIENLHFSLSDTSGNTAIDKANDLLSDLNKIERDYLEFLEFTVTSKDIFDEYQIRVRDKDPFVTDVTIVRVLEIKKPDGAHWDDKLAELATSIKQGMPFEDAEARYPSRKKVKDQIDQWVTLKGLPHEIDEDTVKAGDVYGLEKTLSRQGYYDPMVKIYEVKKLPQVRLSDVIYDSFNLSEFNPIRSIGFNPHYQAQSYLRYYLIEKATERKKHLLMSQLWANFSITENGNPIQRVGIYQPCSRP